MERPFASQRPIGPFGQTESSSGLEIVVFTNVDIPQSAASEILDTAEVEMGRQMESVTVMDTNTGFVIDVGPEILLEHEELKTYEDMLSAVVDELSDIEDQNIEITEVTARCDTI